MWYINIVEVVKFGWQPARQKLEEIGCTVELRKVMGDEPFITDNGNYILDCEFERIEGPEELEEITYLDRIFTWESMKTR